MKTKSHNQAQAKHAKIRAVQRYDSDLQNEDLKKIVQKILNGQSQLIIVQSHSRSVHDVEYREVKYRVVYHKINKQIATFLPPNEEPRPYF